MTGTCDSVTTGLDEPGAAARDEDVDEPAACMSSFTLERSVPGTSWMLSAGMPAAVAASARTSTSTRFER
jgi:hypothetical protein